MTDELKQLRERYDMLENHVVRLTYFVLNLLEHDKMTPSAVYEEAEEDLLRSLEIFEYI